MDWDDVKYFLAVAREGQMLGAARRLRVSQPRLSRRLQALETALQTRLFDRSTRGCTLTDAGRAFLESAERMEAEALGGLSRLNRAETGLSGTIRIGAPDGLGSAFLAPRLGSLIAAHPTLHVQLVPLPRNFSLAQREADIAITIGSPTKGRLRAKALTDYSLRLYASRDYLDRSGAPERIEDLRDHPLVGYVDDLVYTPELNYADEFLTDWKSTIEVSTAVGQFAVVRSGAGIGILHDFMAAADDALIPVFPERRAVRRYFAVWHENMRVSSRVTTVIDMLESMVRQERRLFIGPHDGANGDRTAPDPAASV